MTGNRFGAAAFLSGVAIAAIGMALWQDWWMLAFPFGGATVALLASRLSPARALGVGLAVAGAILLAMIGLFEVVMGSLFGNSVPCMDCPSRPPTYLFLGLGALGLAFLLTLAAVWAIRRGRPRDIR